MPDLPSDPAAVETPSHIIVLQSIVNIIENQIDRKIRGDISRIPWTHVVSTIRDTAQMEIDDFCRERKGATT